MEKVSDNKINLSNKAEQIRADFAKKELSDEELLTLMAESIVRSYTFQEKGYR